MRKFSANLGFLWTELTLPDAIRAAKYAGFDAVECHWPYDIPVEAVRAALSETDLPMIGINKVRGDVTKGESGLLALERQEAGAEAAIHQAIEYAAAIDCRSIHAMAGVATGQRAHETFVKNLKLATAAAKDHGITILIEPLNPFDAPGYFLSTTAQARAIIDTVAEGNLALMFDCYHYGRTEGNVVTGLRKNIDITGHIQFAAVPDRGSPDHGDVDYGEVFAALDEMNYTRPLGAEYRPDGNTDASLSWMKTLRA